MRTVAIIQARMASTRLPGKVMLEVAGTPLLGHVVRQARQARGLDLTVVATSDQPVNDVISCYCTEAGVPCFRGSEADVLDRYFQAAKHFGAEVVVRLTADCPLLDPAVIDRVVEVFRTGDCDYASNTLEPTYPDGLDTEVFGLGALARAWREAHLKSEREHVTPYIWKHPEMFRLASVKREPSLSGLRWTVDEPVDLEFVRRIYSHLGSRPVFGMAEVLAVLRKYPELSAINARLERNEGYQKSLGEDAVIAGSSEDAR